MILSNDQLYMLTNRTRADAQAKVLQFMGVDFFRRPDGSLAVSISHVEAALGARSASKGQGDAEPNWSKI